MNNVIISDSIKYIGVDDTTLDLFESQYIVPNGVSYNSYLILDEVLQRSVQKRIAVKVKKQHRYLEINDIMYAESDKHVLNIHLKDSRVIQTTEKLSELKKTINSKRFIRCHQSYLVNMDYIKDAKTDFILSNDIRIPIRVRGRKEIIERYHKYYSSERMNDHL